MSHQARAHAQIQNWSRAAGTPNGQIVYSIGYRRLEAPDVSGVITLTTIVTDHEALIDEIQEAIASLLSIAPRDVFVIGV